MTVARVMGSETEYGILAPQKLEANPTILSAHVVNTYDTLFHRQLDAQSVSRWDYAEESPLLDSYGTQISEEQAHPSQLTHRAPVLTAEEIAAEALKESGMYAERLDWDAVTMNSILPNGARLYVDHAHPEYSSPEVLGPFDAVLWDAAGDYIAARTVETIEANSAKHGLPIINLYKNNTDSKGQSYGSHENYTLRRDIPFDHVVAGLLPFFATRQIMIGAGRLGIGTKGEQTGFQISQRADFFERLVGLETTIRRPIVNSRDEPHADSEKYRRLHVIAGDANLSHYSNLLKFGTASLVLNLIEAGCAPAIKLADPVAAMHTVSHDLTLSAQLPLAGGGSTTALEIQYAYLNAAAQLEGDADDETKRILELWEETLDLLENDLLALADRLDWVAKYQLLSQYVAKGISWDNPKLAAIDLQYTDVRPTKGLYFKLVELGRMKTLFSNQEIKRAAEEPPHKTRAYLRGKMVSHWSEEIVSANWETIVIRDPETPDMHKLVMAEPQDYTKEQVEKYLNLPHAKDFFQALKN